AGRLSLPFTPAPWLDVEVAADLRETWWGAGQATPVVDGVATSGLVETGGLTRSFGQLSVEATGPKFFRVWQTDAGRRFKHVIEPRLLWQFSPQSDYREPFTDPNTGGIGLATPIPFDEIEGTGNAFQQINQLTYGVRQRLLARRPAAPVAGATPQLRVEPGITAPPWGPASLTPAPVPPQPPAAPQIWPAPGGTESTPATSEATPSGAPGPGSGGPG